MNTTYDNYNVYNWIGINNTDYFTNIYNSIDRWSRINLNDTLNQIDNYKEKVENLTQYYDNYT